RGGGARVEATARKLGLVDRLADLAQHRLNLRSPDTVVCEEPMVDLGVDGRDRPRGELAARRDPGLRLDLPDRGFRRRADSAGGDLIGGDGRAEPRERLLNTGDVRLVVG